MANFFDKLRAKQYVEVTQEDVIKWTKAIGKGILAAVVTFGVIFDILYILFTYLKMFPTSVEPNLAMEDSLKQLPKLSMAFVRARKSKCLTQGCDLNRR
ncbi:MAG: hypothetical protein JSV12_06835 [Candidatus Bathyarchaeota archaeon]|nr:MAG: hypothetical protein JSV12_06835 [Candidatus Bathyarchaeota archaeon]